MFSTRPLSGVIGMSDSDSEQEDESIFDDEGKAWRGSQPMLEEALKDHYGVNGLWLTDGMLVYFDGDEEHPIADDVGVYGHYESGAVCVLEDELPGKQAVQTIANLAGDRDD